MFKQVKQIKIKYIILLLMALFILFNGSLYNLLHNKIELSKLKKRNAALDADYPKLEAELNQLQKGDAAYIESVARTKYHLSRPGEIEFRITEDK